MTSFLARAVAFVALLGLSGAAVTSAAETQRIPVFFLQPELDARRPHCQAAEP